MVHIGRGATRIGVLLLLVVPALSALTSAAPAQTEVAPIELVQIEGVIDPPVARHIAARVNAAADGDVQAVVLQLDTPGGLRVSNTELVRLVEESSVPVIAWIAPRDAQATSTGALLVHAADRSYAAEAAVLDAVVPATLDGSSPAADRAALALYERTAMAFQGRSEEFPLSAGAAVEAGHVDGEASSLRQLLEALDGAQLEVGNDVVTLETWDESAGAPSATIRFAEMNPFSRLLHAVTDPKVALMLFLAGLFGIIFELYNPGIGLAAIVGAGALALSVYSLSILPTNWTAVLVIAAAVGLLLVDLHAAALGLPSALGVVALAVGCAFLFSGAPEVLQLSPWAIVAAVAVTLLFFISVMTAALRVRLRRPVGDDEGVVGTIGEATTDIAPEGTVLTKGTLWRARTMETGIAAGAKVEVKATEGLVLLVEPLHEHDPEPTAG
jgi:membrane-bound serine protease (ClpP class)